MPDAPKPAEAAAGADKPVAARPPEPIPIEINGKPYVHEGDPKMPLLWFLRDRLRLTGTKYACDDAGCGACTVLVDGTAARACALTMQEARGTSVTTIEGVAGDALHAVQQAWIEEDATHCGYCQPGQIMAALDLLRRKPRPGEHDIAAIGNLCRCGNYPRMRRAILRAAAQLRSGK